MNASAAPALSIVVLAAGFSARLGQPKALARIRGEGLLRRTVRLLATTGEHRVIVVVPPGASRIRAALRGCQVDFGVNSRRAQGMSTSVRCGLRRARYSAATLLLPMDLAALTARDLGRLLRRWQGSRRRVVARKADDRGVTPLILPRRFYAGALRVEGDSGLRHLVGRLPGEDIVLLDLPSAALDVDTRADLERARRRTRRGGT